MRLSRKTNLPALSALAALALTAVPAHAQSGVFSIGNIVGAAPGGTGSFDVLLTATGGSLSLGGFTVQPTVTGGGDVLFTAADFSIAITTPYVFPDSFDQNNALPLSVDSFPNTSFNAGDSDNLPNPSVTLADKQTVGLAHVTYQFKPNASPPAYAVSFDTAPGATSLSDGTGTVSYGFTTVPGALTVSPTVAPEPSSVATLAFAGLGLAGLMLRARTRRPLA